MKKKQVRIRDRKAVWIDPAQHAMIAELARKNGTSFGFQVDRLLKTGLAIRRIPIVSVIPKESVS